MLPVLSVYQRSVKALGAMGRTRVNALNIDYKFRFNKLCYIRLVLIDHELIA